MKAYLVLDLSIHDLPGFMPYISYAHTAAPELTQAGGVSPELIADNQWLAPSNLREAGVKWSLFEAAVTGSLAVWLEDFFRAMFKKGSGR